MDSDSDTKKQGSPTTDDASPDMEPPLSFLPGQQDAGRFPVDYWQAQSFASRLHREFQRSLESDNIVGMKSRFYQLLDYYEYTLRVLRDSIKTQNAVMTVSALRSLIALDTPMTDMHRIAPGAIPLPFMVDSEIKRKLVIDLIIKSFQEVSRQLSIQEIAEFVNRYETVNKSSEKEIGRIIEDVVASGYLKKESGLFRRTKRTFKSTNLDDASLLAFLGKGVYEKFEQNGFPGLSNIANREKEFHTFFENLTGFGRFISDMFLATVREVFGSEKTLLKLKRWHHFDLINSIIPRPYQRDAFSIFRGYGYQGQLIEAPTGSGKTLIGMMTIQDWMKTMAEGETILVLVPTVNYEQQWIRELCYKSIGLKLSPEIVFGGSAKAYIAQRKKTAKPPSIVITTYTSLAQLGSPKGKGGFDRISVEKFLQGSNTRYIILDEVHKVAEKIESVSASVTKLLVEWLHDGSLEGLIGFSGTAKAYRRVFEELGLELVYIMPSADLIAYGFVAPFAELGVPFTHSEREQEIIGLLDQYKTLLREYVSILGSENLRRAFFDIPLRKRKTVARVYLEMYSYRKDQDAAISNRFRRWRWGDNLLLTELPLLTIIQISEGLSDADLLEKTAPELLESEYLEKLDRFNEILLEFNVIRKKIQRLVLFSDILEGLSMDGFGTYLDIEKLQELVTLDITKSEFRRSVRRILSSTIVGLYNLLRSLHYRMGEGRVGTINAIINAERSIRKISSVIIFGRGRRIRWESGLASPGYSGVAGIFSQMLGRKGTIPIAVLSSEMYLPWSEESSIPVQVSEFIRSEILGIELANTLFSILTQGLRLSENESVGFRRRFDEVLSEYLEGLTCVGAKRPREFEQQVLIPLEKATKHINTEESGQVRNRLNLENAHMKKWMTDFYNYAMLSTRFLRPHVARLEQTDGHVRKFYVVKMAYGEKKQLMYDLAARIVDADNLPINAIIVSSWARTGWNVIKPNLLIDATATRNATAWHQLRGRTMRALKTWDKGCYESMMLLLGQPIGKTSGPDISSEEVTPSIELELDEHTKELLLEVSGGIPKKDRRSIVEKVNVGDINKLTEDECIQLAASLMLARNKVTHIYEMVKAYGSTIQVKYDKRTDCWRRAPEIASKHSFSYSIDPITGKYSRGESHAPLIYHDDPRLSSPMIIEKELAKKLNERDIEIIKGWIRAVIS